MVEGLTSSAAHPGECSGLGNASCTADRDDPTRSKFTRTRAPSGPRVCPGHWRSDRVNTRQILVTQAERPHPFPSRTRQLSSPAPKILRGQLLGNIGRRQDPFVPGRSARRRGMWRVGRSGGHPRGLSAAGSRPPPSDRVSGRGRDGVRAGARRIRLARQPSLPAGPICPYLRCRRCRLAIALCRPGTIDAGAVDPPGRVPPRSTQHELCLSAAHAACERSPAVPRPSLRGWPRPRSRSAGCSRPGSGRSVEHRSRSRRLPTRSGSRASAAAPQDPPPARRRSLVAAGVLLVSVAALAVLLGGGLLHGAGRPSRRRPLGSPSHPSHANRRCRCRARPRRRPPRTFAIAAPTYADRGRTSPRADRRRWHPLATDTRATLQPGGRADPHPARSRRKYTVKEGDTMQVHRQPVRHQTARPARRERASARTWWWCQRAP